MRDNCRISLKRRRVLLITNDDGIHAMGLCALHEALKDDYEIYVVAPDSERSAVGHAITLVDPLRVRSVRHNGRLFGWAINGTPADCVKLAVYEIVKNPIEFVVSGINTGANVGINVLYSGTVSAATEAAMLGIPSMAISLNTLKDPDFCTSAYIASKLVEWAMELSLPGGVSLNVNVPAGSPLNIKGVKWTRQGLSQYKEQFDKRIDPRGDVYYWQASKEIAHKEGDDVDSTALDMGYITITPLKYDLTAYEYIEKFDFPSCF